MFMEQMLTALRQGHEGNAWAVKYALLQMLVEIWQGQTIDAQGIIEQEDASSAAVKSGAARLNEKIIHFLRQHYYLPELSLGIIARAVNTSKSHASRQFKLDTGLTITEYLSRVRIDAAKRLLLAGLKVGVVAEFVDFTDPYYFSRVFTQSVGCSPTEYRCRCQS
jgi:two-component system response regulator YesN